MTDTLYDSDFFAWTQEQAQALRRAAELRVNAPPGATLDWLHLANEVEDMGKSDARALESHLARVIEHLLKLEHAPEPEPRRGWRTSVAIHRDEVGKILDGSPSLRASLGDRVEPAYRGGRKYAALGLGLEPRDLPAECPFTLDQLTDDDWWPTNRHGLP